MSISPILAFSIAVILPTPCFGYTTKSLRLYILFSVGCFFIFLISGFSSIPEEAVFFSFIFVLNLAFDFKTCNQRAIKLITDYHFVNATAHAILYRRARCSKS